MLQVVETSTSQDFSTAAWALLSSVECLWQEIRAWTELAAANVGKGKICECPDSYKTRHWKDVLQGEQLWWCTEKKKKTKQTKTIFNSPGSQSPLQKSIPLWSGKASGKVSSTQKAKNDVFESCSHCDLQLFLRRCSPLQQRRRNSPVLSCGEVGAWGTACQLPAISPLGSCHSSVRRKPSLLPFPASPGGCHRGRYSTRKWGQGSLATVSSGCNKLWCPGMRGSNQKQKQPAERMPADGAPAHAASLFSLSRLLLKVIILFGGAACFLCPLVWSVELFTPHDLEHGVNGWVQEEIWIPAIKCCQWLMTCL